MTSIGETLRRERQKRNLDLNQVSRELKISTRFLEAIESEEFERLPGGVFAKSFVRQYARLLDVDEEEAAAEVQRTLAPLDTPQQPEIPDRTAAPVPNFAPRVESISNRHFISGSWLPALVLVVAVMLGCSLVYGWWQREHRAVTAAAPAPQKHPAAQPANPAAAPTAAPAIPPQAESSSTAQPPAAGNTEEAKPAEATADAKSSDDKTQDARSTASLTPAGAVTVVLKTSDDPVWVSVRTDGKYSFSGTLEPNQTRTVDANGIVLLRLGDAGGISITVNGKPIPTVGPKGQVRTIQLTSGGFHIVAPPKPSATPEGL